MEKIKLVNKIKSLVLFLFFMVILVFLFESLWNASIVPMFSIHRITFWQTESLLALIGLVTFFCSCLFSIIFLSELDIKLKPIRRLFILEWFDEMSLFLKDIKIQIREPDKTMTQIVEDDIDDGGYKN